MTDCKDTRTSWLVPMWPDEYPVASGIEVIDDIELRWMANLNLHFSSSRRSEITRNGVTRIEYELAGSVSDMDTGDSWDEAEPFIDGWVKFDGCYHLRVGNNGYVHLCGEHGMAMFVKVLDRIRALAREHTDALQAN